MATDNFGILIYDSILLKKLFFLLPKIEEDDLNSTTTINIIGEIQQQFMTLDCCSFNSNSNLICGSGIRGAIIWDLKTKKIIHYIGNV